MRKTKAWPLKGECIELNWATGAGEIVLKEFHRISVQMSGSKLRQWALLRRHPQLKTHPTQAFVEGLSFQPEG